MTVERGRVVDGLAACSRAVDREITRNLHGDRRARGRAAAVLALAWLVVARRPAGGRGSTTVDHDAVDRDGVTV